MPKPIRRNLTHAIVEHLGRAIATGEYNANNMFPIEADLCKQMGASRTSLREAVKMLTAKGLLSARPRQGTIIEPERRWNLLDPDVLRWILEGKTLLGILAEFAELRLAIEPMAARIAARTATPASLARMHHALKRMQSAEKGEDEPLASDIAFHVSVLQATENRFYMQFEQLVETALAVSIRMTNKLVGARVGDTAEHMKVYNAIEGRDGDRAYRAMEDLINHTMKLINNARRRDAASTRTGSTPLRKKR